MRWGVAARGLRCLLLFSFSSCSLLGSYVLTPATAEATDDGNTSTTVLLLDRSGSMDDPLTIPADFPQASELRTRQVALGRALELAHPGERVPLSVMVAAAFGLGELRGLRQRLDDFSREKGIDPASLSKLAALRQAASGLLAELQLEREGLEVDDRVGLVTFADAPQVVAAPSSQTDSLTTALSASRSDGATNLGAGLLSALDLLRGQPRPSVILVTDGWNDAGGTDAQVLSGPVRRAAASRVPICTVGLGLEPQDVNQRLLHEIATRTGGGYYFAADAARLQGDLVACHHSLTARLLADFHALVGRPHLSPAWELAVPASSRRLTVTLTSPAASPQLELRVGDPAGRTVDAAYPGAHLARSGGIQVITITQPGQGHWQLSLAGPSPPGGPVPFTVAVATDGVTTAPHQAELVDGSGPLDRLQRWLMLAEWIAAGLAALLTVLLTASLVRGLGGGVGEVAGPAQPLLPREVRSLPPEPVWVAPNALGYSRAQPPPPAAPPAWQRTLVPQPPAPRRQKGRRSLRRPLSVLLALDLLVLGAALAALQFWMVPLLTFPS